MKNKKEVVVAKTKNLPDGQMQQISVGDSQILLTKIDGKYYATGAFCTHYGAPLEKGILCGERVVCPWHNACFNAISGQQEEPPGLDSLPSFPIRVEGEDILVQLPEKVPSQRTLAMAKYSPKTDNRTFVILGAGAAGSVAAEYLRQQGFLGKVVMITKEEKLPYDRTMLSKTYLQGDASEDSLPLRSCEFYAEHDIELVCGKTVIKVDAIAKTITYEDDSTLSYDTLLLATGGKARKLDISGSDLANIFTLRQVEDVDEIINIAKSAKQAVVIGSSFIGMEAASSLTQRGLSVTVVSPDTVPFEKILGEKIGKMWQQVHAENGVSFRLGTKVTSFEGNNQVTAAVLENGDKIPADLVIVGIGVEPNTGYLEGIELAEKDNSVPVNEYLQAAEGLYAAGDIARFPYAPTGEPTRIEHWRLAAQHGRIAAHNMIRKPIKFASVPFFWTGQFGVKMRYAGHATDWDEIIFAGSLDEREFLAFYVKDNSILAVAGINRDREVAAITELMRLKQMPEVSEIRDRSINWLEQLRGSSK